MYYIVRTLETYIRKYMGTTNKKYPNIKGLSENYPFFDGLSSFTCFEVMGTILLKYGYISDLNYTSL